MHFLITAGGTREYIDPVRFISNASSGRMGCALAETAIRAGHIVTLIAAPLQCEPPHNAEIVNVVSAEQMFKAVRKNFSDCDCLIMAAAVSDYTPASRNDSKIKKDQSHLSIELEPTADILAWAGRNKRRNQIVAGFALEDIDIKGRAEQKMLQKNLDMIIANTPQAIASEKSEVLIKVLNDDWLELKQTHKHNIAKIIIKHIERIHTGNQNLNNKSGC